MNDAQNQQLLKDEYLFLQHCYEENDRSSLMIKVIAIIVGSLLIAAGFVWQLSALFSLSAAASVLFWLTEAIWKTFQSRLERRILAIEDYFQNRAGKNELPPLQIYNTWLKHRGGVVSLIAEYAKSMCRPTIVLPYVILVALALFPEIFNLLH